MLEVWLLAEPLAYNQKVSNTQVTIKKGGPRALLLPGYHSESQVGSIILPRLSLRFSSHYLLSVLSRRQSAIRSCVLRSRYTGRRAGHLLRTLGLGTQ
jgi:hypothetical protein